MTVKKCDSCGSETAKTYKYEVGKSWKYTDLCVNCVQDWVLRNQKKLTEATNDSRKVIFG